MLRGIVSWFQVDNTAVLALRIAFVLIMAAVSAFSAFGIVGYLRDYHIFQMIWAHLRGKSEEFDRIRREQMKEAFRDASDIMAKSGKEPTLMQKIYRQIAMSGLPGKIPGFMESSFLVLLILADLCIVFLFGYKKLLLQGIVIAAVFTATVFYLLSILAYQRAIVVEDQMLEFVNLVASTSRQYSSLVDIFGMTYEHFRAPLSTALEEAYVEAKQTNNMERAMFHLKDKFDSTQFEFVVDNLVLCSKENGQYFDVAMDLSKIEKVYYNSFQKKKQLLRQAKINLTVMFALAAGIIAGMGQFVGGGWKEVVFSNIGIVLFSIMVFLYVYAMNMKAR